MYLRCLFQKVLVAWDERLKDERLDIRRLVMRVL